MGCRRGDFVAPPPHGLSPVPPPRATCDHGPPGEHGDPVLRRPRGRDVLRDTVPGASRSHAERYRLLPGPALMGAGWQVDMGSSVEGKGRWAPRTGMLSAAGPEGLARGIDRTVHYSSERSPWCTSEGLPYAGRVTLTRTDAGQIPL